MEPCCTYSQTNPGSVHLLHTRRVNYHRSGFTIKSCWKNDVSILLLRGLRWENILEDGHAMWFGSLPRVLELFECFSSKTLVVSIITDVQIAGICGTEEVRNCCSVVTGRYRESGQPSTKNANNEAEICDSICNEQN